MIAGIYLGSHPPAGAGQVVTIVVTTRGRIYAGSGLVATIQVGTGGDPVIRGGPNPVATIQQLTEI